MNWLSEQYENERRKDDLRAAEQEAKIKALLAESQPEAEPRRVRQAVGEKLVEWGKRLQDNSATQETLRQT
jgi:hypothetical protein